MSIRRNSLGSRLANTNRQQQSRMSAIEPTTDSATKNDALSNTLPEVCTTLNSIYFSYIYSSS
jgi:hypothetical protein